MRTKRTGKRNRSIFAAHQNGEAIEDIAKRHGISGGAVYQIIMIERHKVAVSVDPFYKNIRSQKPA